MKIYTLLRVRLETQANSQVPIKYSFISNLGLGSEYFCCPQAALAPFSAQTCLPLRLGGCCSECRCSSCLEHSPVCLSLIGPAVPVWWVLGYHLAPKPTAEPANLLHAMARPPCPAGALIPIQNQGVQGGKFCPKKQKDYIAFMAILFKF